MRKIGAFLVAAAIALPNLGGGHPVAEPVVFPAAEVQTVRETEPVRERFVFGQEVWAVRRSVDGGGAYVVRYAVFAREGDLVAVVPMFTTDPEELRQVLKEAAAAPLDGTGHLVLVEVGNCYGTQEEAQAAADRENADGQRGE